MFVSFFSDSIKSLIFYLERESSRFYTLLLIKNTFFFGLVFNLLGIFDCRQFWRGAIQVPTFTGDSPEGLFNVCVWLVLVQWENFIYDICSLCWGSVISFGIYSCNSCDLIIGLDPHMGWWLGQLIMRFGLFVELLSCPPFVGNVRTRAK